MSTHFVRSGRIGVVIAVVFFLAAGTVIAKPTDNERDLDRGRSVIVTLIKTPVLVIKNVAVVQDKLERHVSSRILHAGVVAFTRAMRWFADEERPKAGSSPSSLPRSL